MVIVEVEIGTGGRIRAQRILQALPVPSLSLAVLEALRQWRFDPATRDGQPVAVRFELTVRYQR